MDGFMAAAAPRHGGRLLDRRRKLFVKRAARRVPLLAAVLFVSASRLLHGAGEFATDPNGRYCASHGPAGVAAEADGHPILLRDVASLCLRRDRAAVIDQMVQDYVLERACAQAGIKVSGAEVDAEVAALRQRVAPLTLEAVLAEHQTTMPMLRASIIRKIQRRDIVAGQVAPVKMVHCRAIFLRSAPPGAPAAVAGTTRSEAAAAVLMSAVQARLRAGKDFGTLADQYSEASPKTPGGDFGIVYPGLHDTDPAVVQAALALDKNGISPPIKSYNGCWLLQAVSTDADRTPAEAGVYRAARNTYVDEQSQFLSPAYIVGLIERSHLTFATDLDCDPPPGRALPAAAATVDGHVIPMSEVAARCLAADGPHTVDILVQNYLVDQECRRRHLAVPATEIDRRIAALSKLIAPHTLAEGLRARHMTEAELRSNFQQDRERVLLVEDRIPPPKMAHCRAVQGGADLGIFYPGIRDVETAVLDAGLALNAGETTAHPLKIATGDTAIQCLSTLTHHPKSEDSAYAAALDAYKDQQAQMLTPQAVIALIKKRHVVYYVHA